MQSRVAGLPPRMGIALALSDAYKPGWRDRAGDRRRREVVWELQGECDRLPVDATELELWNLSDDLVRQVYRYSERYKDSSLILDGVALLCRRLGILQPLGEADAEKIARAVDRNWWARSLRKEHARRFEHVAIQLGFTSYRSGVYLSNESAERQTKRNVDNAKMMARTELQNEFGQTYTLEELAALGTANKSIRRGELMTRIRGFEEIAQDLRHVGMFWTITCPSSFHAVLAKSGDMNPRYAGASPRDAQAYLCKVWARIRAKLHRAGIRPYGFRIAEPHHDGCPHWHMLLFVDPKRAVEMENLIRAYALAQDGDEPGAQENRVKLVNIEAGKGTAAGYIAKYVAKNIDGAHVGEHKTADGWIVVPDMLGKEEITPSQRVTLWSQLHGIRQFQQIGGPPIGVWRELRRVPADVARRAPTEVVEAWRSCQRSADELASFSKFAMALGGPTAGRNASIRIARRDTEIRGKYATYTDERPCGVYSIRNPKAVYESVRYRWTRIESGGGRERGGGGDPTAAPWTGVNNCTPSPVDISKYDLKGEKIFSFDYSKEWKRVMRSQDYVEFDFERHRFFIFGG